MGLLQVFQAPATADPWWPLPVLHLAPPDWSWWGWAAILEAPRGIATPSFPKVLLPNLCPSHATSMASLAELTAPLLSLSLSLQWGPQPGRGRPSSPRCLLAHPTSQHQVRAPLAGPWRPRRLSKGLPLPLAPGPAPGRAPTAWAPPAPAAHYRRLAPVVGPGVAPILPLTPGEVRARGVPTSLPVSLEKTQQLRPSPRQGPGGGKAWFGSKVGMLVSPFPCVCIHQ